MTAIAHRKTYILIPAYNESDHITRVVSQAKIYAPVLVVDDGSLDTTPDQAEAAGAKVIRQVPNQGKGAALLAGFKAVLELDADLVITLDADGQHDPDEIPLFIEAFSKQGDDLIIGVRTFDKMPLVRRLSNTIGGILFSWAMGRKIPDNQSGYRLLSRRLVEAMLLSDEGGFEFEVDMFSICVRRGFSLGGVPIKTIYGDEKSHISPLKHAYHFLRMVIKTRRKITDSRGK